MRSSLSTRRIEGLTPRMLTGKEAEGRLVTMRQLCLGYPLTQRLDIDANVQQGIAIPSQYETVLAIWMLFKANTVAIKGCHSRNDGTQNPRKEGTANQRLKHKAPNSISCHTTFTSRTRYVHQGQRKRKKKEEKKTNSSI